MTRLEKLEQHYTPQDVAWLGRSSVIGPIACRVVSCSFHRNGDGPSETRSLNYAKWKEEEINRLTEEEFAQLIGYAVITEELEKKYRGMSLLDFLNSFNPIYG